MSKIIVDDIDIVSSHLSEKEKVIFALTVKFQSYMHILRILTDKKRVNGISYVSQKELAIITNRSQSYISQKLIKLVKYGAIEKVKPGQYIVLNNDISYTPYIYTIKVLNLFYEQPQLFREYKKQGDLLGLTLQEVQSAWGYLLADITNYPRAFYQK